MHPNANAIARQSQSSRLKLSPYLQPTNDLYGILSAEKNTIKLCLYVAEHGA
jgi:hypothetical protein